MRAIIVAEVLRRLPARLGLEIGCEPSFQMENSEAADYEPGARFFALFGPARLYHRTGDL